MRYGDVLSATCTIPIAFVISES